MNRQYLRDSMLRGKLSRREFGRIAALAGVGVSMMSLGARSVRADGSDVIYYVLGGFAEEGLFKPYVAKTGALPSTSFWGDEEEAFIKLRTGFSPDVTYCGTYSVPRWRDADLLQPIDVGRVEHWADLIDELKSPPGTTIGDQHWHVPIGWGTTSVLYRTDLVEVPEESWGLLWDERYKGRLAMIDGVADAVAGAAIYAGVDPYTMDEAAIAKVKTVLTEQRPLLRMYTSDMTSLAQSIASGEIVAAMTWNDTYATLRRDGVPVAYMLHPKEGLSTFVACVTINKASSHLDLAYDLINSLTDPESGQFWMTYYGLGHANTKAYSLVPAADLEAAGLTADPAKVLANSIFQSRMENEDKIATMFESVKAGG
jgi:spermidine/putrescine transport system substrate-binding protein